MVVIIMAITLKANDLKNLLEMTQRKQTVAGKTNPQVMACVLRYEEGVVSTTSLVRDGKTSVSRFTIPAEKGEGHIVIPDIDRMLGVLKAHSGSVTLTSTNNTTKIKSAKKQTTLTANAGALAFPHSAETIGEWEDMSRQLMEKVSIGGSYQMRDGSELPYMAMMTVDSGELSEALSCDNINGQKLNRYTFTAGVDMVLTVGDPLKGQTEINLGEYQGMGDWNTSFEGGLENVVSNMSGEITLYFLDFRQHNQGIRMILTDGTSHLMQAGVIDG